MKQFYDSGRTHELNSLDELYNKDGFAFAVVYGRRRVGKTSLIDEFVKRGKKKAIRFTAVENTDVMNRARFSRSIFSVYPTLSKITSFPSWESAFDYIVEQAKGEKLILEIDEYPYIAKAYPPISSELQAYIDLVLQNSNIMLILCGSSMSFMENQVLGYQSPLYGRRTAQYQIGPLDYYDSAEFFAKASLEDKLLGYAVTGGVPQYLSVISEAADIGKGIDKAFFTKEGFLYEEPQNLLKQELREPAVYNAIITAVANGATKLNDIAAKVKEPDSKVSKYIKGLIELDIIEKEISMFAQNERNGIYRIKDGMYRFWYRFVPDVVMLIENRRDRIYEREVSQFVSEFMGHAFEDICKQYLIRLNVGDKLPFLFKEIGRWWGGNPITKKETEIDIIASSSNGKKVIIGECKWQNTLADVSIYANMKERAAMFADKEIYFFIFSKTGFTEGLMKEAERNDRLTLVGLKDLFNV
jgi:AAA+ ATPase superfamily predicted ATPase